ncbi:MAG: FlgO family outer membrane protein [Dissulfuribacterales bacterium]
MKNCIPVVFVLSLWLTGLTACEMKAVSIRSSQAPHPIYSHASIFDITRELTQELLINLQDESARSSTCIVTTFVRLDNLKTADTLGRLLAEGMGNELVKAGMAVTEIRNSNAVSVHPTTGELILSRDKTELKGYMDAAYALTGTYSVGERSVTISVRLLDLRSNRIVAVASNELIRTPDINALLSDEARVAPTTYDRLPSR